MHSPERVTMLSDGVFAIVLTILVLELKVPHGLAHKSLGEAIHELRPTFLAWTVSFLITGMYWVAHRDIFARVRTVNRDLVWLNLLFLLPMCPDPLRSVRTWGVSGRVEGHPGLRDCRDRGLGDATLPLLVHRPAPGIALAGIGE